VYEKLGLQAEEEKEKRAVEEGCDTSPQDSMPTDVCDDLVCGDEPPQEEVLFCDWKHPMMMLESRYKDMAIFQLAMRQFAIKREFELGIEATCPNRYRGYCKGGGCPWRIHARVEIQGAPTVIVCFFMHKIYFPFWCFDSSCRAIFVVLQVTTMNDEHRCTSSARRKTTTPTSAWVASLALPILKKKSFMGTKELQTTLQDTHNCTIVYETVWKGKEKALGQLYGTWEDNFQLLFRWKVAVLEKMHDSVIEIDLDEEEGKLYFRRFFCALSPCLQGFHEGCMPYLSVDSIALNGR
jgi:hypothetical protein